MNEPESPEPRSNTESFEDLFGFSGAASSPPIHDSGENDVFGHPGTTTSGLSPLSMSTNSTIILPMPLTPYRVGPLAFSTSPGITTNGIDPLPLIAGSPALSPGLLSARRARSSSASSGRFFEKELSEGYGTTQDGLEEGSGNLIDFSSPAAHGQAPYVSAPQTPPPRAPPSPPTPGPNRTLRGLKPKLGGRSKNRAGAITVSDATNKKAFKRAQNTLAARRSRAKKTEELQYALKENERLHAENNMWKDMALEIILEDEKSDRQKSKYPNTKWKKMALDIVQDWDESDRKEALGVSSEDDDTGSGVSLSGSCITGDAGKEE